MGAGERPRSLPDRPAVWDAVTLSVAEAVRKGEHVAAVALPCPYSAMIPESPMVAEWLDRLQSDITVIKIELQDTTAGAAADDTLHREGQRLVDMGRRLLTKKTGGETLHSALTVYGEWIDAKYRDAEKQATQWGRTQGRQVTFLRRVLPDGPLVALDAGRIDELIELLRQRPAGEDGTPVSVSWTRNVIKQFRHFLRWLNKSAAFSWTRPADLEFAQVRIPLTPAEKGRPARAPPRWRRTPRPSCGRSGSTPPRSGGC